MIKKELNTLRLESRRSERTRKVKANQYDWDELADVIHKEDEDYERIKYLMNDEWQVRMKEIHDFEVFKNTMKETVEQMDVWNAWDKEVVEKLGNEKDLKDVLEAKLTF